MVEALDLALFHLHLGFRFLPPLARGFKRQIGTDCAGTIAHQTGKVMGTPALGSFHYDRSFHAQALINQAVVYCTHSQQWWQEGMIGIQVAIGENDDFRACFNQFHGAIAEIV
jgi:hypothetical protein